MTHVDKKEAVEPIKLFNISQVSNGVNFYNTNKGSQLVDEQVMDFKYNPDSSVYINVEELKLKIRGAYNVRGLFHWLSHKKSKLNLHQKSQHDITNML